MSKMKLQESVDCLIDSLRNDKDFYYGWQSNIAMAFFDANSQSKAKTSIHEIANTAAKNFLNNLTFKPVKS